MRNIHGRARSRDTEAVLRVEITSEAKGEIRELGGRAAARIGERIRHLELVGWEEAMRLKLVKDLGSIQRGIYEVRVTGTGEAYRLMCFPTRDQDGRLVVITTCVAKSGLLGHRLKAHVQRAAQRRDQWLRQQEEEDP